MKKGTLTLNKLKKIVNSLKTSDGEIVGFISGVPVVANKAVPKGEIWMLNEKEFYKLSTPRK